MSGEPQPLPAGVPEEAVRRLLGQAFLFDDPASYEAGVRDALDLLTQATAVGRGAARVA